MRTLATLAAAALTLAACTTSTAVERTPPVRHVELSGLPEQPAHDHEGPPEQPPGVDRGDPAVVAVALVVDGLAEQGLEVIDLAVERVRGRPEAVTVRVAATHQPAASGPSHTSVYELDLARGHDRGWRLVGSRQTQ